MKILQLDVDKVEFRLIKPESNVYEESEEKDFVVEDSLFLLVSIEKNDTNAVAEKAVSDAISFMSNLKRARITIYPFAHLSNSLESPQKALQIFKHMRDFAVQSGLEVYSAPFGWNKQLSIDIKGHPLAEQSRSYSPESSQSATAPTEGESQALKEEEKVKSFWYILDEKGVLTETSNFDFSGHENLKKFADYEIKKQRVYAKPPVHIQLMKKLGISDYESGSDSGNLRFYPNGRLIKGLLEAFVTKTAVEYGAVELETPLMYDYGHKALNEYLNRFPSRHYIVKSDDKDFFLRFSADFGQFLLIGDTVISYKQMPFKFYELTRYSFRREKSGELVGMKRLRAFTMPDMHTICTDLDQAEEEFRRQFWLSKDVLSKIGIDESKYETAIRFTQDFWKDHQDFIKGIVKELKRPVLIEMWNYRYAYFDPKFEFNIIDSLDKATALSTVQIDHENGKRYDMTYIDSQGKKQYPLVLHCSPSGAIERVIYALLEISALQDSKPHLPLWLSPTQIRLLPLSDKFISKCEEIAAKIQARNIRVDIDDTESTLSKKIMNAEEEWIPYICVVGQKEIEENKLSVRERETGANNNMDLESLMDKIDAVVKDMPKARSSLPMMVSKRPIFNK